MDNYTVPPDVVRYAQNFWKLLRGRRADVNIQIEALRFIVGDHRGNMSERVPLLRHELSTAGIYRNQPKVDELIHKWKKHFEPKLNLSVPQAESFILALSGSSAHLDEVFGDCSTSGVTKMERGHLNDSATRRPAGYLRGWSLNLSTSEVGHYNCIRQELQAGQGDMVLLSPEAMYDYRRASQASHWIHHWIYFQTDERLLQWLNWEEVGPHIYHIRIPEKEYPIIRALFESTLDFNPDEDKASEALLLSIAEQIFIRCSRFPSRAGVGFTDARVRKAMDYIGENLEVSLTVQDIAHHVQLSRTQLSRLFKDATGRSLVSWREERRIAKASQLLAQSSLKIQQISERVGYEDPLYFSRVFSRLVGVSPMQYRKMPSAVPM